jgi:hypothetical protein
MSGQLHAPNPLTLTREISRVPDINKDWVGSTVGVDVLPLPATERFLLRAAHGLVNIATALSWLPITIYINPVHFTAFTFASHMLLFCASKTWCYMQQTYKSLGDDVFGRILHGAETF